MIRLLQFAAAGLLLALSLAVPSHAGLDLSLEPDAAIVEIPVAGTASFSVAVRMNADAGTQLVKSYNLPIDIREPIGLGLPTGWSLTAVTQKFFGFTEAFPPFDPGTSAPQSFDLAPSDGNLASAVSFDTSPVTLFDFTVSIDATAIAGDYSFVFVDEGVLGITDENNDLIPANLGSGAITLQAVPEPNSFALLAVGIALACYRRRRAV